MFSLPTAYWLAVTFAPLLHNHTHHLGHAHSVVEESHSCAHHHHDHTDAPSGHGGHSHLGHHHHGPAAPLHDDDCAACRFLALKPAPAQAIEVAVLVEPTADEVDFLVPPVEYVPLPLPVSRGPPDIV